MRTAKYHRIIVRIADREGVSLPLAVELYRLAKRLGVRDFGRGLSGRVSDKLERRDFRHK